MVSQSAREYWTTKDAGVEYDTITLEHPEIQPIRLVLNAFEKISLGGEIYTPCPGKVDLPEQNNDLLPSIKISLPRAIVGDRMNEEISKISIAGWLVPIKITYRNFIYKDLNTPIIEYKLSLSENGISYNKTTVQLTATDDNVLIMGLPHVSDSNPIYTIEEYPGLVRN